MDATTLLMFSGGLDSTAVLWKLIHENESLHIHHMNLRNIEKRARVETIAVQNILAYMKRIRTFTYSESTHVYPSYGNNFMWDSDIVSFMAGNICLLNPTIKSVAVGMTATDLNRQDSLSGRIERSQKIFEALTKAQKIYPVKDMTKLQIWNMLPVELRNMTWSCRTPVYEGDLAKPCEKCNTCKELSALKSTPHYSSELTCYLK